MVYCIWYKFYNKLLLPWLVELISMRCNYINVTIIWLKLIFRILLYCDDVELGFDGSNESEFKGHKKGRLYLTTHRVSLTYIVHNYTLKNS